MLLASDLNERFEKLYKKFGKGKEVPVKFYNGQDISNVLLTNIDHLLEEEDEGVRGTSRSS
jgi:hypothetical protein